LVKCGTTEYPIDGPEPDGEGGYSWDRATFAFFSSVGAQLAGSEYRFYALNGGNDLGGIFLTPAQALAARGALSNRTDWPYLPVEKSPWSGGYH
jgi:hypothetical protein